MTEQYHFKTKSNCKTTGGLKGTPWCHLLAPPRITVMKTKRNSDGTWNMTEWSQNLCLTCDLDGFDCNDIFLIFHFKSNYQVFNWMMCSPLVSVFYSIFFSVFQNMRENVLTACWTWVQISVTDVSRHWTLTQRYNAEVAPLCHFIQTCVFVALKPQVQNVTS